MTDIVQKALNVATAAHSGQLRKYDNEEGEECKKCEYFIACWGENNNAI